MVALTRKQAMRMFQKIGAVTKEGNKHTKISLVVKGKKVFTTVLSRGGKDIPTGTARSIFRALGLKHIDACIALSTCPMQQSEYIAYLEKEGMI